MQQVPGNRDDRNFYGDEFSALGALRPDRSIDLNIIVRQAREYAKRFVKVKPANDPTTYREAFRDKCRERLDACRSRISFLQWQDDCAAERAESDLHARRVDLAIAIACHEHSDRPNFDLLFRQKSDLNELDQDIRQAEMSDERLAAVG